MTFTASASASKAHSAGTLPLAPARFSIVGLGASAGWVEAFEHFFRKMPADSGMAFVLVQHLAPSHASILTETLQRSTAVSVIEAQDPTTAKYDGIQTIRAEPVYLVSWAFVALEAASLPSTITRTAPVAPHTYFEAACSGTIPATPGSVAAMTPAIQPSSNPPAVTTIGKRSISRITIRLPATMMGMLAVLGVLEAGQDALDDGARCRADRAAPVDEPLRTPLAMGTVRGRHVVVDGVEAAQALAFRVCGDAPALVQQLHAEGGEAGVEFAADQCVRHAVAMLFDLDVLVHMHANRLEAGDLVAGGGQRPKRWLIDLGEDAGAAAWQLLERAGVQARQQGGDRLVDLGDRGKRGVPQSCHWNARGAGNA